MVAGTCESARGAPNVVWILIDDVGFGAAGTFGGLIQTPTFDNLANNGLRYTNFHTCAICAPTRAALLTGRNSASVHESGFSHTLCLPDSPAGTGACPPRPNNRRDPPRQRLQHLCCGQVWRNPYEEATDAGPFDHWPTGKDLTTSSDSLARRLTSTNRTWWKIRLMSVPMAVTSAIRSPTKPSSISTARRKPLLTSPSSFITRQALRMLRTR